MNKTIIQEIGLEMVQIPAGRFMMGRGSRVYDDQNWHLGPDREIYYKYPGNLKHEVVISKPFYIGSTVITQKQWSDVMNDKPWIEGSDEYQKKAIQETKTYVEEAYQIRNCEDFIRFGSNCTKYWSILLDLFHEDFRKTAEAILNDEINKNCSWIKNNQFAKLYTGMKDILRLFKERFIGGFMNTEKITDSFNPMKYDDASLDALKGISEVSMMQYEDGLGLRQIWHENYLFEIDRDEIDKVVEIKRRIIWKIKQEFETWLQSRSKIIPELFFQQVSNKFKYSPKDYIATGVKFPAVDIYYEDILRFVSRLNTTNSKYYFRLPTEAEWEYTCKDFSNVSSPLELDDYAWHAENSGESAEKGKIKQVALKKSNDYGLFDMYGNVWEMCSDWFAPYENGPIFDPEGPEEPYKYAYKYKDDISTYHAELGKVIRGGSIYTAPGYISCDFRTSNQNSKTPRPEEPVGFRLVAEK